VLSDLVLQRAACAAGLGLARLPCFFGDPLLPRRTEPEPAGDVWVLIHPDLRRSPRVRGFCDAMIEAFEAHRARLRGVVQP
jgi:DNA-binding transcriptional LysR family regulator